MNEAQRDRVLTAAACTILLAAAVCALVSSCLLGHGTAGPDPRPGLVRMHLLDVRIIGAREAYDVLLTDDPENPRRVLHIFIGETEAIAIARALAEIQPPRPMTHDLLRSTIEKFGAKPVRVVITSIEDGIYYAELVLLRGEETIRVDCRPSDGLALAVRTGTPIYAAQPVIDEAAQEVKPDGKIPPPPKPPRRPSREII